MTRKLSIIILFLFSNNSFGQEYSVEELEYHPKTFDEAIVQLDKMFSDSSKVTIINMTEGDFVASTHFDLGMWIRNEWLYNRSFFRLIVTQSDLRKELASKGLPTNDDMSGLILRSFYRKLTGQELAVEQQIKEIQQFYMKLK